MATCAPTAAGAAAAGRPTAVGRGHGRKRIDAKMNMKLFKKQKAGPIGAAASQGRGDRDEYDDNDDDVF